MARQYIKGGKYRGGSYYKFKGPIIDYDPEVVLRTARIMLRKNVGNAAKYLRDMIKLNISSPWPPASEPFDFPRRRTGELHESIEAVEIEPGVFVVRHDPTFGEGPYIELGTRKRKGGMLPRPHIRKTFTEKSGVVRDLMTKGFYKGLGAKQLVFRAIVEGPSRGLFIGGGFF